MHLFRDSLALLFVAAGLAACSDEPPAAPEPAPPEPVASTCGDLGALQGTLSGAINVNLDWSDQDLLCESMPRPDARGVRIRLSGEIGHERLAVIISLPDLKPGLTGSEVDSVVTIGVDGSGRFFSTANLGTCWVNVTTNAPLAGHSNLYNVVGELSCVGPLGEFNGDAFIDIRALRFSGLADWGTS